MAREPVKMGGNKYRSGGRGLSERRGQSMALSRGRRFFFSSLFRDLTLTVVFKIIC